MIRGTAASNGANHIVRMLRNRTGRALFQQCMPKWKLVSDLTLGMRALPESNSSVCLKDVSTMEDKQQLRNCLRGKDTRALTWLLGKTVCFSQKPSVGWQLQVSSAGSGPSRSFLLFCGYDCPYLKS